MVLFKETKVDFFVWPFKPEAEMSRESKSDLLFL